MQEVIDQETLRNPHANAGVSPSAHTLRLLVVDDEPGIRDALRRLLVRMAHPPSVEIVTAESAEAALQILENASFALILTDFNMDGRDGVYLLATALERWPETQRVLMTGYTDESIAQQARERGGAAVVVRKPWNNAELVSTIRDLVRAQRAAAPA